MPDNNEYDPGYARERLSEMIDHGADIRTPRKKALDRYNHDRTDWMINLFNSDDAGAMPKLEDYEAEEMKKAEAEQSAADMAGGGADGLINSPGLRLRAAMTENGGDRRERDFGTDVPAESPFRGRELGTGINSTEGKKHGVSFLSKGNNVYAANTEPSGTGSDFSGYTQEMGYPAHADTQKDWRTAEKQSMMPYDPIAPLTKDLTVYEDLKKKYPLENPMIYSKAAIELAKSLSLDINNAGQESGVPPEAIVGAMADEKTRYDYKHLKGWNIFQDMSSPSRISYSGIKKYVDGNPDESTRERSMFSSNTWDIGSYNINAATGYEVFRKNVLAPGADGMIKKITMQGLPENATDEQKWDSFRDNCLLSDKGGVYVVASVLKEYDQMLRPYMQGLSGEEQAALVVTAFKQGPYSMLSNYNKRIQGELERGGDINWGMLPGEGRAIYYNAPEIREALEWGFGQVRRKYSDFLLNNQEPVWDNIFRR